jgi:hypothetical protein
MKTIQIMTQANLDEILQNPKDFVDETFDKPLVKILSDNPVWILIGRNENDGRYYLVVEDDEVSEDYYPENNETLEQLFDRIIEEEQK